MAKLYLVLVVYHSYNHIFTGHFDGKALPSAGGLPFLQPYMSAYKLLSFTGHFDGKALLSAGGLQFLKSYMTAYNICYLYRSFLWQSSS